MKNPTIVHSFKKAWDGFTFSLRSERHIQLAMLIAVAVAVVSFFFKLSGLQWIAISLSISFVVTTELLNTAIEKTIDMFTEDFHHLAEIAKDVSAAAVVVAIINAVVVGAIIFVPKLMGK